MAAPRVNILGVGVSVLNMQIALENIEEWIASRQQNYVCVTPIHAIMDCYEHPELRKIFNCSGMTTPDGMGVVWVMRLKGFRKVERVYGPDLMLEVCKRSVSKNWGHFFYGGSPSVVEKLAHSLKEENPGLKVVGTYSPPFRPLTDQEDQLIIQLINQSQADIVWVGIGSPKQERWMSEHLGELHSPVMIGVGAAFDFLSGSKKQAPLWVQRSGVEWLFRLMVEPRRLWTRYIKYPIFFLLLLAQSLRIIDLPIVKSRSNKTN